MSLINFARAELQAAGLFDKDSDYNGMIGDAVMALVRVFSRQGHSGFSAGMVRNIFDKVSAYEPLTALQGNDSEWNDVGHDLYQNNRCSHVFKDKDGAYDINGKVFVEPDGLSFTCKESRVPVVFPYNPTTEYVNVGFDKNPGTNIPHDLTPIDDAERARQLDAGRPEETKTADPDETIDSMIYDDPSLTEAESSHSDDPMIYDDPSLTEAESSHSDVPMTPRERLFDMSDQCGLFTFRSWIESHDPQLAWNFDDPCILERQFVDTVAEGGDVNLKDLFRIFFSMECSGLTVEQNDIFLN